MGKGEENKNSVEDQKPQNANVWITQQAEERINSRIRKPFPWMSPKPQTLAQRSAKPQEEERLG